MPSSHRKYHEVFRTCILKTHYEIIGQPQHFYLNQIVFFCKIMIVILLCASVITQSWAKAILYESLDHSPVALKWEQIKKTPISDPTSLHIPIQKPYVYKHRLYTSPTTTENPMEEKEHTTDTTLASIAKDNLKLPISKKDEIVIDDIPELDSNKYKSSQKMSLKPVYRGSYKFSWDDVNDMHKPSPLKTLELKVNTNYEHHQTTHHPNLETVLQTYHPIPPVPTLSPWYDGYGK